MKFVPKELKETADISRGIIGVRGWIKPAVVAVLILGLLYLGIGVLMDLLVANISAKTEAQWFTHAFAKAAKNGDQEFRHAQRVFQQLTVSADLRPLPYQLFVVDIPHPNALAVPGGGVGVSRSLLREIKSDIGLATVLAHELGHQQHRHGLKRFGRGLLWRMLLSFALGGVDTLGLEAILKVTEAGYSREQEREADVFALKLVHKVYGDTQGALEFFELVQREYDQGNVRWMGLLSSHPLTAERIGYLKEIQQQLRESN